MSVTLVGEPTPSDIIAARAAMRPWMQPPESHKLVQALAELRLLVRRRSGEIGEDLDAQTVVYARRLNDYPADVVMHVVRKWGDREMWWPSWAELKAHCDRHSARRRAMMAALDRAADRQARGRA